MSELKESLILQRKNEQTLYQDACLKIILIKKRNEELNQANQVHDSSYIKNLQKLRNETQNDIESLKEILETLDQSTSTYKQKKENEKLKAQASKEIDNFTQIMRQRIQKESFLSEDIDASTEDAESENTKGVFFMEQNQPKQTFMMHQNIEKEIAEEKQVVLNQLAGDITQLNFIMKDIAMEINQQGQYIDLIEDNSNNVHKDIKDANQELREAKQSQKKIQNKYIIIGSLIITIFSIVVIITLIS